MTKYKLDCVDLLKDLIHRMDKAFFEEGGYVEYGLDISHAKDKEPYAILWVTNKEDEQFKTICDIK